MTIVKLDFVSRRIGTMDSDEGVAPSPTYVVLTSKLYPIVSSDYLNIDSSARGGFAYQLLDNANTTANIVSGELRTILKFGYAGPESVNSTSSILAGELRQLLKFGYFGPEAIDTGASAQSGLLINKLVLYTNWTPEAVDTGASLISGTLT